MRIRSGIAAVVVVVGLAGLWAASSTWRGYYWMHSRALNGLASEIAAYGKIHELEMGTDDSYEKDGKLVRYDSYRFVNGTVVTHYRERHAPEAGQPIYYIDDYCRVSGISKERYLHFRRALGGLRLQGFSYEPATGVVSFTLRNVGGDPVVTTLDYIPDGGGAPAYDGTVRVAPHWYVVERG